jgi:hypothetical protein
LKKIISITSVNWTEIFYEILNGLGKPGSKWENNIKIDYKENNCEFPEWMQVSKYSVKWWNGMNVTLKFLFPKRGIYLVGDDGPSGAQIGLSHDVNLFTGSIDK